MTEYRIEEAADIDPVRRVAGLITLAKTEPVPNRLFRFAVAALLKNLDTIGYQEGTEARTQATQVACFAQSIIGARYFHHIFPEIVSLEITNLGPADDFEASFRLRGLSADGTGFDFNDAQAALTINLAVHQIFADQPEFIPEQGEDHTITLNLAALYADHVEPDDGSDEVFGLEHIPSDVTPEQVEEARTNGDSAIDLIIGVSNGKHINPIPDSVVRCANAEAVRRYQHDGAPRHINFGLWLNGLLLARAVRAKFPQIGFVEAGLHREGNKVMLFLEVYDLDDEMIDLDDADTAAITLLAQTLLLPNSIYGQYVWDNDLPIRVEINNILRSVPGPPRRA